MASPNRFSNLSARVLNALDRDFPGWQDLVPSEKDSELNEESLIKLLKDRKRAEIYRIVADKRNAFLKKIYEDPDTLEELTKEFSSFSYDQTHKWIDMEGKLSSIILEFRAENESDDVDSISQGVKDASTLIEKGIDDSVNDINTSVDNYLGSFFNRDANGVSRVGSNELRGFLQSKTDQFKANNQIFGDEQKEFIDNSLQGLIQSKIDKVRSGKLSADALNRSDLFTDEEINDLRNKQHQVIVDSVRRIKNTNVNTINEMSSKFIGVTGKENILKSLDTCPKHIISPEIKQIVEEAIDYGCIFEDEEPGTNRQKRAVGFILAKAACMLLDSAAYALEQVASFYVAPTFDTQKGFYYFCNEQTQYWAHLFTFGVCSIYTLAVNIDEAKKGGVMDFKGMANVLSGFSFLIGLFTGTNIRTSIKSVSGIKNMGKRVVQNFKDQVVKKAKSDIASKGCEIPGDRVEVKLLTSICKGYVLVKGLEEDYDKSIKDIRKMFK